MFGLVGWTVAVPALIGVAIGLWIDSTWPSRFSWTLMLLVFGVDYRYVEAAYIGLSLHIGFVDFPLRLLVPYLGLLLSLVPAVLIALQGYDVLRLFLIADLVAAAFDGLRPVHRATSMDEAVRIAAGLAKPGDAVVLSPGCASFDWYRSYGERGDDFARAVREVAGVGTSG